MDPDVHAGRGCDGGGYVWPLGWKDAAPLVRFKTICVCLSRCSRVLICILIECELRRLSCIMLHIVCRMDHSECVAALNIKQAQPQYMWIIHSGNRDPQDHQMNIKPLMKASLWHDTLQWSWAASNNGEAPEYDESKRLLFFSVGGADVF